MVSDLLGSRRLPSKVQLTFNPNVECQFISYVQENTWARFHDWRPGARVIHATWPMYIPAILYVTASLTLGNGSPSAAQESSMSDPTRIVEFFGAVVITGGSEQEMRFFKTRSHRERGRLVVVLIRSAARRLFQN